MVESAMRGLAFQLVFAFGLVACGPGGRPASREANSEERPPESSDPELEPLSNSPPAEAERTPLNLLRAVATEVAVSSAYRDRESQVVSLIDENLESAWNSRTNDLEGAWIEVRLPQDAQITSLAMTAGFTRRGERVDLFTGNHRVRQVRVLREGSPVGTFELDLDSRALQTIEASGPGGVWRIELVSLEPGSRADWRETCVSELQVMGTHPGAGSDRFPRYAIGSLPPAERTARAPTFQAFRDNIAAFARVYDEVDQEESASINNTGDPDLTPEEVRRFRQTHRQLLRRLARLVEASDEAFSDHLRRAAAVGPDARSSTLNLADRAFATTATSLGDRARCRWATAHVGLRLARIERELRWIGEREEWGEMELEGDPAGQRDARRRARHSYRALGFIESARRSWPSNRRVMIRRLDSFQPELFEVDDDWNAIRAQRAVIESACP